MVTKSQSSTTEQRNKKGKRGKETMMRKDENRDHPRKEETRE